jgi:hypothetical protein
VNPLAKLAGFAVVLALVFGGAALAGSRIDVHPGKPATAKAAAPGMAEMEAAAGGHGAAAPKPVRGLAVAENGLTLELARRSAPRGSAFPLAFRVVDRRGRTVRDFDVEHTKRMHLIVVRRDMTGFQHLHPRQQPDGSWSVPVVLRDAGAYRVFADVSIGGRPRTLAADLFVDGTTRSRPLPAASDAVAVDGMRVALTAAPSRAGAESDLRFTVTRGGRPVALEDYLGAKGHLVALRDGDLAFLHVHPDEDAPRFMAEFPSAGRYRLYLQFRVDGRVHTAELTREVSR